MRVSSSRRHMMSSLFCFLLSDDPVFVNVSIEIASLQVDTSDMV